MWDPQHLTNLRDSTAYYGDSFSLAFTMRVWTGFRCSIWHRASDLAGPENLGNSLERCAAVGLKSYDPVSLSYRDYNILLIYFNPLNAPYFISHKSRAISLRGRGGLQSCEILRVPRCLDNRLTDGGKVVSPTHRPHFTPQKHYYFYVSGTHFC
jgi:hypothetical protein